MRICCLKGIYVNVQNRWNENDMRISYVLLLFLLLVFFFW